MRCSEHYQKEMRKHLIYYNLEFNAGIPSTWEPMQGQWLTCSVLSGFKVSVRLLSSGTSKINHKSSPFHFLSAQATSIQLMSSMADISRNLTRI